MDYTISLNTILYISGAIATISAAIVIITKLTRKLLLKSLKSSIDECLQSHNESFNNKIESLNQTMVNFIESQNSFNDQFKKSLLSSTRDRINQAHDYYMRKKFIGAHSLFVVEELYTSYKQLGGNSFVDKQMEDIRNLEVRSAEINDSFTNR